MAAVALPSGQEAGLDDPCAGADAAGDIVVPVFLFLQNSPGADIVGQPPQAAGELAVPLAGLKAAKLQIGSAAWIRRLEAGANVCPSTAESNDCVAATNSVPALAAPLGWSLSGMSQHQLEKAGHESTSA